MEHHQVTSMIILGKLKPISCRLYIYLYANESKYVGRCSDLSRLLNTAPNQIKTAIQELEDAQILKIQWTGSNSTIITLI